MEIKRQTVDGIDLSVGVLLDPLPPAELAALLHRSLKETFPGGGKAPGEIRQVQYRRRERAIELFMEFTSVMPSINPTEATIDEFLTWLVAHDERERNSYWTQLAGLLRVAINGLPETQLARPLLTKQGQQRAGRMNFLTPKGAEILREFLLDGRRIKWRRDGSYRLTVKLLSPMTRESSVGNTLTVLRFLKLDDPRLLTATKVDEFIQGYAAIGKRDTAIHNLADMRSLYRNITLRGHIHEYPLAVIEEKPCRKNKDYIEQAQIDKLCDLSNVNWSSLQSVRDRLICLTCLYDFCLRINECASLDLAQIRLHNIEDEKWVCLDLEGADQKGMNKEDTAIRSWVPESYELVKRYLELRWKKGLAEGPFIVDERGKRIGKGGINGAINRECERLGITTRNGLRAAAHRWRHSFATINAYRVGYCLSLEELQVRLRHTSSKETAVYIQNNAVLQDQKHRESIKQWKERKHDMTKPSSHQQIAEDLLDEPSALRALAEHDIKSVGLRQDAESRHGIVDPGGSPLYRKAYIDELASAWIRKQEAADILGMSIRWVEDWAIRVDIERRVVGKVSLVRIRDVLIERKRSARQSEFPGDNCKISGT